jgi:hypothetical protein
MEDHYVRVYKRNMYLHYFYRPTVYAVKLRNFREKTKRDAKLSLSLMYYVLGGKSRNCTRNTHTLICYNN